MLSKLLFAIGIVFYVIAGFTWLFLGLFNPTGVDRLGQPLNPELFNEIGSVGYNILGAAYLVPVIAIAAVGLLFTWLSDKARRPK
jgi:hypothetical protein